jgi:hypothetical protein
MGATEQSDAVEQFDNIEEFKAALKGFENGE